MTNKIILHSTFVQADGIGDLSHFLNHLKLFKANYQGNIEQRVLILAAFDIKPVINELIDLYEVEPTHPIFDFINIDGKNIVTKTTKGDSAKAFVDINRSMFGSINLKLFFSDITAKTNLTHFQISSPLSLCYKDAQQKLDADNSFGIFELEGWYEHQKTPYRSSLGLGAKDFGLLHDVTGVNGAEDITECLEQLKPTLKELLFQNKRITNTDAMAYLIDTPIVLTYLSCLANPAVLSVILESIIIQKAIQAGKKPLFIITGRGIELELPENVQSAVMAGEIRIKQQWLPKAEYKQLITLLVNRHVNSIIVPSGDNTLTLCIKTGKFPFYAHQFALADFSRPTFKCQIFKDMARILHAEGSKMGWDAHPGFKDCKKLLVFFGMKIDLPPANIYESITAEMLDFFKYEFSPYLMRNFAFENKTLPRLLVAVDHIEAAASKPLLAKFNDRDKQQTLVATPVTTKTAENPSEDQARKDKRKLEIKKGFFNI